MSKALGQQVVVENVTGAGGTIGSNRVAKAAPDGYQLILSGSGTHAAIEYLHKEPPYKPGDWEHIGLVNVSPVVLVARKAVPANTLQEFIAYLRANEKKVTEADAGVGSISNLACSVFHSLANVSPTVVSYRGTPQATQDVVAGNVDFGCNQIVNIVQHVQSGALKAYAITGDKRSPMLPDVPTTAEAGLPAFKLTVWFGLSAPKGTPRPIIEKLNKALAAALDDPATVKRFADLGYDVVPPSAALAGIFRQVLPRRSRALEQGARRAGGPGQAMTWKPARELSIVAGTPPGGGLDRSARALARAIEANRLVDVPVAVVNVPGDGGRNAWVHMERFAGDGHVISISSPNMAADYLMGVTKSDPDRYPPLAILYSEYIAFVVRTDSAIRDGGDLVRRFRGRCRRRHRRALDLARQFQPRRGRQRGPSCRRRSARAGAAGVRHRARCGRRRGGREGRCRRHHGGQPGSRSFNPEACGRSRSPPTIGCPGPMRRRRPGRSRGPTA